MVRQVLVVDDANLLVSGLLDIFATLGYRAWCASNGAEALRHLEYGMFDVVLLDLNLPDIDGYQLCRQIRQRYGLPVVMMSGLSSVDTRVDDFAVGASAFVGKPFSLKELHSAIQETLIHSVDEIPTPLFRLTVSS